MRFSQSMMYAPADQFLPLTRHAEEVGFDQVTVSDHVFYPADLSSKYPYTDDGSPQFPPETEWPEAWVTIGALAAATSSIRFATHVYVLPARNPFEVAKAAGTAAFLSGNRVALGVGAGWMREEFDQLGQPFERRGRQMDEMIEVLRTLWQGGMVEHHGDAYDFGPLQIAPVPSEPVPILIGGHSEPALRRAARLGDGWMGIYYGMDELRSYLDRLGQHRADAGREHEPFEVQTSVLAIPTPDVVAELEEMGVGTLITSAWLMEGGDTSSLDANRAALDAFAQKYIAPLAAGSGLH